ncbi:MAG: hypothetical protein ACK42A_09280 [Pyrinomonadaceae bacterium]
MRSFMLYHNKRCLSEKGSDERAAYLKHLIVTEKVSGSRQNRADFA